MGVGGWQARRCGTAGGVGWGSGWERAQFHTMCVKLGLANSKGTKSPVVMGSFFLRSVQMPLGPLHDMAWHAGHACMWEG